MTSRKGSRAADHIEHILAAIARIETYVDGLDQAAFFESPLVQDAVIRNLEIIGEAANRILSSDPAFAAQHANLKLEQAYRMRNALAHGYDAINLLTVWNTIADDLPTLRQQAACILKASR